MFDLLIAYAMLAGDTPATTAEICALRPSLLAVGIASEVIDPKEAGYTFMMCPVDDLASMRIRWRELAMTPHLGDCNLFPGREFITEHQAINRSARSWYVSLAATNGVWRDVCEADIARLDREYAVWDNVRDAHQTWYYVNIRRQALANVRAMIGDEDYFGGRLP